MARMCLNDEPHVVPRLQTEGVPCGKREVDADLDATIDSRYHNHIPLLQRHNHSRNQIARADAGRPGCSQQDVPGPNSYAQAQSRISPHKWSFDLDAAPGNAASHGASGRASLQDGHVKDIFEAGKL